MALTLVHAKYQILETLRVPIAVVGTTFFPTASMLFFVVPNVGDLAEAATLATGSMVVFTVMISCLFSYGIGVAEDREKPWDPFMRTLPAGPGPRFGGRVLSSLSFIALSIIPVVIVAALLTEATATPLQLLLGLGVVLVTAVPFTLLGLAIGYALPMKAAIAVAQLIFFPMAFGAGLLGAPGAAPSFVEAIAPYLPARGAAELMWATFGDYTPRPLSLLMLGVWILGAGTFALWAYRRDEGRRFA